MSRFGSRKDARSASPAPTSLPDDPWLQAGLPTIWEYLTREKYDSGEARRTSTVMAFVEDGQVKMCLNDRDLERSCWVAGETLERAFLALEAALGSPNPGWRRYKAFQGKPGKGG